MHDPRISALLRLKRFEQPPPDYFEGLPKDVHRRQRTDLLQRPLWKIAVERIQVFFSEHSMGNLSYAGAMTVLLAVGIGAIGLMTPSGSQQVGTKATIAEAKPVPVEAIPASAPNRMLVLGPQNSSEFMPLVNPPRENSTSAISAPRYIIDARPVSYEPVPSFSF